VNRKLSRGFIPTLMIAFACMSAQIATGQSITTTYDGWTGGPIQPYVCTDAECTSSDGCGAAYGHGSDISQYDWYWAQTRCQQTSGEGHSCSQSYELCRETQFFPAKYCYGAADNETQNFYGACG
jgi:hypothetical protein